MCPGQLKGCKRGVYGLDSWEPLRKPGASSSSSSSSSSALASRQETTSVNSANNTEMPLNAANSDQAPQRRPMLAKYTYKANKISSPLGKELSVAPQDQLTFINYHKENNHWMLAEDASGDVGYVPAIYMLLLEVEKKPSSLPWLNNQPAEEETASAGNNAFGAPEKPAFKPYKSAYDPKELTGKNNDAKQYYCEVCEKQLNGPKPYQAHMVSKAHKEELEFRNGES